jgi:formylglycine-generating enzyme required for sulfatase activity
MPTIDQWTYAASGGKWTRDYTYSGSNDLDEVAWFDGNRPEMYQRYLEKFPGNSYSMPVGMKKPNELGIYDMSGNMMEQLEYSYTGWGERYEELDPEESNLHTTNLAGGGLFEGMWYCEIYHGYWTTHSPNDARRDSGLRLLLMASSLDK